MSGGGPMTPFAFFEKFGVGSKYLLLILGCVVIFFGLSILDLQSNKILGYAFATAPVWLPIGTFTIFFDAWLEYVRKEFNIQKGRVTLEIKLPQDVFKSPEAMELVLVQLHQTATPDNHVQTYFDGKHPPTYGLELVSRGGDVKIYINTQRSKFKNITETQLYAQYPGIEVHELDIDYTAEIPWNKKLFSYFSIHFGLKKADAYPIKTYIEYELNKMPKEEEKVDPINAMIEMLGSMKPGEYMWVQILINANREVTFLHGSIRTQPDWRKDAENEIKTIVDKAAKRAGIGKKDENIKNLNQFLSDAEKETIKSIQRSIGKNAFNVGIRGMYIAKKDIYNPGERIGALITGWRSYDDLNRNAIGVRWRTDYDWNWWQDPKGHHAEHLKKVELDEYKRRVYTQRGHADSEKVMTVEELATIFHLPGRVATTPSLARIPSKRSEPPPNLPVG